MGGKRKKGTKNRRKEGREENQDREIRKGNYKTNDSP